jgi:hypothetical protein|tara:strand:+ start:1126 stop:1569 length:444 start_codon:yes stop_codon:yes gene_type:complete
MATPPQANDDTIATALNLDPIDTVLMPLPEKLPVVHADHAAQNLENDYKYARENLYNVIERGTDALNGIVDLAQQSQHPRSFEVVADLVRTLAGANKDLLAIQKQVKDLQPENAPKGNVTNNLFVGTTKDITDLLAGSARDVTDKTR